MKNLALIGAWLRWATKVVTDRVDMLAYRYLRCSHRPSKALNITYSGRHGRWVCIAFSCWDCGKAKVYRWERES